MNDQPLPEHVHARLRLPLRIANLADLVPIFPKGSHMRQVANYLEISTGPAAEPVAGEAPEKPNSGTAGFAVLRLCDLKLIRCGTMDEVQDAVLTLRKQKRLYIVLRWNAGVETYVRMEVKE